MLGRLLKTHRWHKRLVTHAATLWALVAFAMLLLVVFGMYSKKLTSIREGAVEATPIKTQAVASLPTVFGSVISYDGQVIELKTKQAFSRILVDELTETSTIGGSAFDLRTLQPGMTIMATGNAEGAETLLADALVVLTDADLDTKHE